MDSDKVIKEFKGISLRDMEGVKLMNRTDRKYWFHSSLLSAVLEDVVEDYYILEIEGERNLPYSTTYYDTEGEAMYGDHQRGKLNRYKIRRRNYVATKSSFLEVKFKSNKGRTIKVRRPSDFDCVGFDMADRDFIAQNTPYTCGQLREVLNNRFRRLMLVSREMDERCTIDSALQFRGGVAGRGLDDLVIVEVKTDGRSRSRIIEALQRRGIKPSGFSKYCVGRSLIESTLKQNNFKRKLREIAKRINISAAAVVF